MPKTQLLDRGNVKQIKGSENGNMGGCVEELSQFYITSTVQYSTTSLQIARDQIQYSTITCVQEVIYCVQYIILYCKWKLF